MLAKLPELAKSACFVENWQVKVLTVVTVRALCFQCKQHDSQSRKAAMRHFAENLHRLRWRLSEKPAKTRKIADENFWCSL
jgi:hypothetical protein